MLFDSLKRKPGLAPGDLIEVAGRPVRFAVHARARRVSLRLDTAKREVVATAPSARRLAEAAAFAQSRREWIAARLDGLTRLASAQLALPRSLAREAVTRSIDPRTYAFQLRGAASLAGELASVRPQAPDTRLNALRHRHHMPTVTRVPPLHLSER